MSSSQKTGDNSIAVVARGAVSIHTGVSVADVKDIVRDMLKESLAGLQREALQTAQERNERLLDDFLTQAEQRFGAQLDAKLGAFSEPGAQFAFRQAQVEYCRYGSDESKDASIELLVERLEVAGSDVAKIVIDEALASIGKLNARQLRLVAFYFVIERVIDRTVNSEPTFKPFLDRFLAYGEGLHASKVEISMLTSLGLLMPLEGIRTYHPIEKLLKDRYSGLFFRGEDASAFGLSSIRPGALAPCLHDNSRSQPNNMRIDEWAAFLATAGYSSDEIQAAVAKANENLFDDAAALKFILRVQPGLEALTAQWNDESRAHRHRQLSTVGQAVAIAKLRHDKWLQIPLQAVIDTN